MEINARDAVNSEIEASHSCLVDGGLDFEFEEGEGEERCGNSSFREFWNPRRNLWKEVEVDRDGEGFSGIALVMQCGNRRV